MDIDIVLENVDRLLENNNGEEAEQLMLGAASIAMEEQDGAGLLRILNELLGYYRVSGQVENSYMVASQALEIASQCLPEVSLPYATTLLNVATVYRSGGRLEDSMELYRKVEFIYQQILPPDHENMASFYNNWALLYQEMGDFAQAKKLLLQALPIVEKLGNAYRIGASLTNLAGSCLQLGELEDCGKYAHAAVTLFEEHQVQDSHYSAALSALGSYFYSTGSFAKAEDTFQKAMHVMEKAVGKNAYYDRLQENYEASRAMAGQAGLAICKKYYETYAAPAIEDQFPEYKNRIAVGLVGEGSDCFGLDDALSRDHDWGPSFCIWLDDETYEAIGDKLQALYDALPAEMDGIPRSRDIQGNGRRGVMRIRDFYERLLGTSEYEQIDWSLVSDAALAAATNGEVFADPQGDFLKIRKQLQAGYPEPILYAKVAEAAAKFSQSGQYNYARMLHRGDEITAGIMLGDALREAMKLLYYLSGRYPLHDKWLLKGIAADFPEEAELLFGIHEMVKAESSTTVLALMEQLGEALAMHLYQAGLISDIDSYLDHHTAELMRKSLYSWRSNEDLAMDIAKLEFKAFDLVQNEGGRASCQNNWPTFSIMRRSQYLTWTRPMLLQYLYDFQREFDQGHNLITEKYGRMMESTAHERYEELQAHFPSLTPQQKAIIDQIAGIQVRWMEEFAAQYPHLADNARSVHSYEDNAYNTSYETYLRGELGTYSDKMLQLYAGFIVELAKAGSNLAYLTMENSCHLYGYESLEQAEAFLAK